MSDVLAKWRECEQLYSEEIRESFLKPVLEHGDFVTVLSYDGESIKPAEYCLPDNEIVERKTGYYARLSASGFMDCTDYQEIKSAADVCDFFDNYFEKPIDNDSVYDMIEAGKVNQE